MNKSLGDRMKEYENAYRIKLPKKSYVVIRVDGKAFHTYTKGLNKPFDDKLIEAMNYTGEMLAKNIMNVKFVYIQSDEISLVLTDFASHNTEAWFDNNIQKMVSVSSSMATRYFNKRRLQQIGLDNMKWAEFDSRAFVISKDYEVMNYLVWRQQDTIRNSISMVADSLYSHKELNGKNLSLKKEMIKTRSGYDWETYSQGLKYGRMIYRTQNIFNPDRSIWICEGAEIFTAGNENILGLINN